MGDEERVTCCIGDLHGYFSKLQNLWTLVQYRILHRPVHFKTALIIFLGDTAIEDPTPIGSSTSCSLCPPRTRPRPTSSSAGTTIWRSRASLVLYRQRRMGRAFGKAGSTRIMKREKGGLTFKGDGFENMDLQGRRWAGVIKEMFNVGKGSEYKGSIYDAGPTFESYGVVHGSAGKVAPL